LLPHALLRVEISPASGFSEQKEVFQTSFQKRNIPTKNGEFRLDPSADTPMAKPKRKRNLSAFLSLFLH
jgi:hypothetical protein